MKDGEEDDRMPPNSTQNLNAKLSLTSAPASQALAAKQGKPQHHFRWHQRVRQASDFLQARTGSASLAVIDERGRIHGYRRAVQYSSASLVKAMLLVSYLNRRDVRRRDLRPAERRLLGPMIRISD